MNIIFAFQELRLIRMIKIEIVIMQGENQNFLKNFVVSRILWSQEVSLIQCNVLNSNSQKTSPPRTCEYDLLWK